LRRDAIRCFYSVIPAKAGIHTHILVKTGIVNAAGTPAKVGKLGDALGVVARLCQNQDLRDWRDLQDFASLIPRVSP